MRAGGCWGVWGQRVCGVGGLVAGGVRLRCAGRWGGGLDEQGQAADPVEGGGEGVLPGPVERQAQSVAA